MAGKTLANLLQKHIWQNKIWRISSTLIFRWRKKCPKILRTTKLQVLGVVDWPLIIGKDLLTLHCMVKGQAGNVSLATDIR